jgi:uncharacterized damage-inducible protein DinB
MVATNTAEQSLPEPWLRGTLTDVRAVPRAVLHALELAREDLSRWCGNLTDDEINARPARLPPVAFHLRHIARSLDRLLTYAEGHDLREEQLAELKHEQDPVANSQQLSVQLNTAIEKSVARVRALDASKLEESRKVGKKQLPTMLGGLLVHIADHTQRHTGQAITTAKFLLAARTTP